MTSRRAQKLIPVVETRTKCFTQDHDSDVRRTPFHSKRKLWFRLSDSFRRCAAVLSRLCLILLPGNFICLSSVFVHYSLLLFRRWLRTRLPNTFYYCFLIEKYRQWCRSTRTFHLNLRFQFLIYFLHFQFRAANNRRKSFFVHKPISSIVSDREVLIEIFKLNEERLETLMTLNKI